MPEEVIHSIILIFTIAASFLLLKIPFFQRHDLQFTAAIFIIYFIFKKLSPTDKKRFFARPLLDSVLFTLVIVTVVNSTGGISSPVFFLNYFLIFALSLILEPLISVTVTLALVIFYLLTFSSTQPIREFASLVALPFLTPFALFLGEEYQKILQQKNVIRILAKKTNSLKKSLSHQKEEAFLFMSLVVKNHLKNIAEAAENFMGDHQLAQIKKQVRRLQKLIDRYEETT